MIGIVNTKLLQGKKDYDICLQKGMDQSYFLVDYITMPQQSKLFTRKGEGNQYGADVGKANDIIDVNLD